MLLVVVASPIVPAAAQTTDPRFFSQTNFRIDNDAFWSFFQGRGGVRTFGYPVSRTFRLDGFQVQIFQRIVMQLQPDGSVATLNLLDPGLLPYTRINGSTFPAPDPALVSQTPPVSDPDYSTKIIDFTLANAPEHLRGPSGQLRHDVQHHGDCRGCARTTPASLLPLFNLQIWGAPTSQPAYDPGNQQLRVPALSARHHAFRLRPACVPRACCWPTISSRC